jgi:hypothetical protein
MRIIINGITGYTDAIEWTYEDIARVASLNPDYTYSITYSVKLDGDYSRSGTLSPKQKVKLDDGMRINIYDISNA